MNEYIDKNEAITALWKAMYEYEDKMEKQFSDSPETDIVYNWSVHKIFVQNMSDIDRQVILNMPIADVRENVHGEWVETTYYFKCNRCGKLENLRENFCPNCGANMQKEEEEKC